MNYYVKLRIKHVFILRNSAGKTAMFFAQRAEAIEYTELPVKSTVANAVDTSFMTLAADGLISLIYLLRSGSGL